MFAPAGTETASVMDLFWICALASGIALLAGLALLLYAVRRPPVRDGDRFGRRLILFGGVVVPTVLLAVLAVVSLRLMADLRTATGNTAIRVTGEQFWWRVEYLTRDGDVAVETANEIHLPLGEPVTLELVTADVIHSFWVPALAGKVDMIPGQQNRLVLEATRTGTFRGQCAEFCGDSHALMAFSVVVTEGAAFEAWLTRQQEPAADPADSAARAGRRHFLAYGCGACHRVRGTGAGGRLGPDLTHVGSRSRIAAGTLPNDRHSLTRWLRHTQQVKPGAPMPDFNMMADAELEAISRYLLSLE